jgi:hypothetical protein
VRSVADDRPRTGRAAARREHQPAGGGDLPRPRRARRDKNKTLGLQQPQRLGYEVWPITPWRGTHSSDLSCANGLSVLLALRISQRGEQAREEQRNGIRR